MKSITILGASGSIGTSALKVLDNHADKFCLHAVSVNRRLDKLFEIIKKYRPDYAVCADGQGKERLNMKVLRFTADVTEWNVFVMTK